MNNVENLQHKSVVGFYGSTAGGLVTHPDGHHVVYPMGAKLIVQHWGSGKQTLLEGHTSNISAVAVSLCGKFLASGQSLQPPFHKASVYVWSFETRSSVGRHEMHGSTVQGVAFSCDSRFLYSIGGLEDHCFSVWDVVTRQAVSCKRMPPLQTPDGMSICAARCCSRYVVSTSDEGIKVWNMELNKYQLSYSAVNMGKLRRSIICTMVDGQDEFLYCGSTTGDIIKIRLNLVPNPPRPVLVACLSKPPLKQRKQSLAPSQPNGNYANGVRALIRIRENQLAIAAGDGTVDLVKELDLTQPRGQAGLKSPTLHALRVIQTCKLRSMVTSLARLGEKLLLVGTKVCDVYSLELDNFSVIKLHISCHPSPVHSLALPQDTGDVFVTCGHGDLRVWRMSKSSKIQEVLRIQQPGLQSRCVLVTKDGTAIISAWNDGSIRAHTPETGRLICEIQGAHRSGVSALGITADTSRIVSGGEEGQVRIWDANGVTWRLHKVFAEQRGMISQVAIRDDDLEATSACMDGTCYIWNIEPGQDVSCKQTIHTNSKLTAVCYITGPASLILTAGSDRRVVCWDTVKGNALRDIETHAPITSLEVPPKRGIFITGFEDGLIKVWSLQHGEVTHQGKGHGASVSKVSLTFDAQHIISTSTDGAIFTWTYLGAEQGQLPSAPGTPASAVSAASNTSQRKPESAKSRTSL